MKNSLVLGAMMFALVGCGGGSGSLGSASSLNPAGMFKRKADAVEVPLEFRDPRAFVPQISGLTAKPVKGGIMLLATADVDMSGYHEVELAMTNNGFPDSKGVLLLEFRGFLPNPIPTVQYADTINVARFLSHSQLSGVNTIQVQAQSNSRSISR